MWLKFRRFFVPKIFFNTEKSPRAASTIISIRRLSNKVEERKVNVNGLDINYVKTGTGPHPVLLLPGAFGTAWTDFKPQIENFDGSKMTIVAWDPPGYGKSRPPDRTVSLDFYKRDAGFAYGLMKALQFGQFSMVGWSDGGITSLIIAANHPNSVRKLVAFGANSYIKPNELKMYESIRNMDKWSDRMKTPLIDTYGEDYIKKMWLEWLDAMNDFCQKNNGDLCKDCVPKIRCPTLLIHGKKDVMVDPEHPEYLKANIAGSQLVYFEKGAHNLHLRYPQEFNELVTKFLLE